VPGQATVTIEDKQWQVAIADTTWELAQGLGGLQKLTPGTGMLFDTGWEQIIRVTTVPMLFPLDIAFLSESLAVTEVYQNIQPGYIVTSTLPARYFLEVNAGELEGIETGDMAVVEFLQLAETPPVTADWTSAITYFFGFMVMGIFMVAIARDFVNSLEPEKKLVLYGPRGERLLPFNERRRQKPGELEYLPDSPEFLAYTIEDIGYRDKLDSAFQQAIRRAKDRKRQGS
jgi:uncharacterized membrane protein (UPF0127 family)